MKTLFKAALLITISLVLYACVPQSGATGNSLPSLNFSPFGAKAVTTSLEDALPLENWIDVSDLKAESQNINLDKGGYYRYDTRSYCLHAGKYGPGSGNGYLIAPLKGSQAGFIASIISNSHQNRDIPQQDIQRIIWAIEAGTSLKNFSGQQKIALSRLASPEDLAKYELEVQANAMNISAMARSLLPQDAQNALAFYEKFNSLVTDANATYEEIEKLAVLTGAVPSDPNDVVVNEGNWARIGENMFMRSFPKTYSLTTVEILKLAPFNLEKDEFGRITMFESEGYRQEVSYYDTLSYVRAPDGKQYPYWEIKEIRFMGPEQDDYYVVKDKGWIIPSDVVIDESSLTEAAPSREILAAARLRWNKYERRMRLVDKYRKKTTGYYDNWQRGTKPMSANDIKDLTDMKHYHEGLKAALTGSPADKASWLDKHMSIVVRAWKYAICMLGGSCSNKDEVKPPVSVPGNRSKQRLATDIGW